MSEAAAEPQALDKIKAIAAKAPPGTAVPIPPPKPKIEYECADTLSPGVDREKIVVRDAGRTVTFERFGDRLHFNIDPPAEMTNEQRLEIFNNAADQVIKHMQACKDRLAQFRK
jgi:hypothetical protein